MGDTPSGLSAKYITSLLIVSAFATIAGAIWSIRSRRRDEFFLKFDALISHPRARKEAAGVEKRQPRIAFANHHRERRAEPLARLHPEQRLDAHLRFRENHVLLIEALSEQLRIVHAQLRSRRNSAL